MRLKKSLACLLAGTMVVSMTACGGADEGTPAKVTATPTPAPQVTATPTPKPTEAAPEVTPEATPEAKPTEAPKEASVNFEDGNMAFTAVYSQIANAAKTELAIVDFNGSKALQVTNLDGKVPYVAFDLSGLLGADVSKVATVEMTLGTTHPDGNFYATSGEVTFWAGADLTESKDTWSVYMETKNPKVAAVKVGDVALTEDKNIMMVSLKTDNGSGATLYIDDLRFLDADGNLLKADTTVAFDAPAGFADAKVDRANLVELANPVEFAGFATSGAGWAQDGFEMPQEFLDALVPGSVIEISYASEDGNIWVVFPDATNWSRVGWSGSETQDYAYYNDSRNTAQIDYEQIVAVCGEDKSTWGARLQCEGSSNWEIFAVKVGQATAAKKFVTTAEFPDFATSEGAWTQSGFDIPQEILDALVPGSVIKVDYTCPDGRIWVVFPDAAIGWSRVGNDGPEGPSVCDGSVCYVTYEQIVAVLGEDKSTWGARLQCEGNAAWEVYALSVGTQEEVPTFRFRSFVEFPGFATSEGAWTQSGFDIPQEILDALVPGSAIKVNYTCPDGRIWVVFPDAAIGWSRVGNDGPEGPSVCDGDVCYVTYEQIAAVLGEDKSTWGARLQCEGNAAWEVYSLSVAK